MPKKRYKKNSWKKLKAISVLKKKFKLAGIALLIVLGTGITVFSASLLRILNEPLKASAGSSSLPRGEMWDGESILNIALIEIEDLDSDSSDIVFAGLLTIFPQNHTFEVLSFPVDLDIDVPQRYGINPFFSIYSLGQLNSPPSGIALTQRTLKDHLAVSIDGYVLIESEGLSRIVNFYNGEFKFGDISQLFSIKSLTGIKDLLSTAKSSIRTDFSTPEILKILNFLRLTRSDKQLFTKVDKGEFADSVYMDSLRPKFFEDQVILEGKSIIILNGTDIEGLAGYYGRFIENIGGEINATDNAGGRYDKSLIIADELGSRTLSVISKTLDISDIRKSHSDQLVEEPKLIRANIAVIVGFDKGLEL